MSQEAISALCPSIFDGSISSRGVLTQKVIEEICVYIHTCMLQMHASTCKYILFKASYIFKLTIKCDVNYSGLAVIFRSRTHLALLSTTQ